jgi:hypothetical protein
MKLDFWVDPICPWCWVTARWMVDAVAPHRDLDITWQPISLLKKNDPEPGSRYHEPSWFTHRLLRVMEAIRQAEGDDAIRPFYWELGRRIHHDRSRDFTAAEVLEAIALPEAHAEAFDDDSWDGEIDKRMSVALELAGTEVGTPIIGFVNDDGEQVALFGPVISQVPSPEQSLRMWDAFAVMAAVPGFWELKRTRTVDPDPGSRP